MSANNYYMLHLEGMDLAGKSTVATEIQKKCKMDWTINNNRLINNNKICDFIDMASKNDLYDDEVYGYLYYVALMADLNSFVLDSNTIQDSTLLLRSINYHTNKGNDKLATLFNELVERHPVPTWSIYLTASIDSRIKRLAERIEKNPEKISKNDSLIISNPEMFQKMDNQLCALSQKYFNSTVLDTTNLSIDEVVDYIIDKCGLNRIVDDNKCITLRK